MPIDISVVIPCLNGARTLGKQLDALIAQQVGAAFEVVVADNGSTDDTAALVRSYSETIDSRILLVDAGTKPGVNAARNAGIRAARGRYIVMCDADDVVQEGWLAAYWQAFLGGAKSVGGGVNRVLHSGEVLSRERKLYRPYIRGTTYADGANCGFTAEAFRTIGGFDESFAGGSDEVDFFWRLSDAGYDLVLVPDAVVDKLVHTRLDDMFRQFFNYGCGDARLAQKFKPRLLGPMVLVAMCQAFMWCFVFFTVARLDQRLLRLATSSLAWYLGILGEGTRLKLATGNSVPIEPGLRLHAR